MKKILLAAGMVALMGTSAMAETIGASIARFDDNGLTIMRNGMTCLLYTSPSPRDAHESRMPSSA